MRSMFESLATDPAIHNSLVILIQGCVAYILGSMGLSTAKKVSAGFAAIGDRRRQLKKEQEDERLATMVQTVQTIKDAAQTTKA